MWIKFEALLCCIIATSLATKDVRVKRKEEKANLEYKINHSGASNHKADRRISRASQFPQYPLFFPVQRIYNPNKIEGRNYGAPNYAVPMEPLAHYSQQDPLYNGHSLTNKNDNDLSRDHSEVNQVYGHPPIHHVIERPVYIKEPEPIIEIIIRESNVTLPPAPTYAPVTLPPRKKEQVQVFYVKYKKNPDAYGKESVIYDKPVAALTPHVHDEHTYEAPAPPITYESPITATLPPPPSTTLRAIIKPDSESYHANKGIHITFGEKLENDHYKRSHDVVKEGSEPLPKITKPQEKPQSRQFSSFDSHFPPNFPNQNYHSSFPSIKSERFPLSFDQPHFGKHFSHPPGPPPHFNSGPPSFNYSPFSFQKPTSRPPPQFSDQSHVPFSQPAHARQPVAYQPFENFRQQSNNNFPPQSSSFQFPRPHSHFPIPQRLPEEQRHIQATQHQFQNNIRNEEFIRQQNSNVHNNQPRPEQNHFQHYSQQLPSQQLTQQFHHTSQQQFSHHPPSQINTQTERGLIPPGGELIPSLNKFEQHISVPANPSQSQNKELQQSQSITNQQYLNSNQQQQYQNSHKLSATNQQFLNNYHQQQQEQARQPQKTQQVQPQSQSQQQHFSINLNPSQNQVSQQQQSKPITSQQYTISSTHQHQQQPQHQQQQQQQQHQQQQQQQYQIPSSDDLKLNQELLRQHIANQQIQLQLKTKQQQSFAQNSNNQNQFSYITQSTPRPTTTTSKPTTIQVSSTPKADEKPINLNDLNIELPDEVPDDLRQQLLSSGILQNAQISVLDYDKVGDIPLSALPPDQLANFYNAGGAQQIAAAGSEQSSKVVKTDGKSIKKESNADDLEMEAEESEIKEVKMEAPLEMKVVRYNPETEEGEKVKNAYVQAGSTQTEPVALNDQQYNRYLPVKVNGASFPIPNVPELVGRNITSVVVLAPVEYSFNENSRSTRDVENSKNDPRYSARIALKKLIDSPSAENYKEWLEKENKTIADKQAVVLLVTGVESSPTEKEIFMYDIATQKVNKLSGELSSAFVEAAETNSKEKSEKITGLSSNVVETIVPYPNPEGLSKFQESDDDLLISASEYIDPKIPIIDPTQNDNFSSASEQLEKFVDISGIPVNPKDDLQVAASNEDALSNQVLISSGYSKTGSNL